MSASIIGPDSPLRALRLQRRFLQPRLRVLMLRDRYHVQEECRAAFVARGHEVIDVWLGPKPSAEAMMQAVLNAVVAWRPDMVMSINFFGFDRKNWLLEVLAAAEMPCAVWCVDSPLLTLRGWLPIEHPLMHLFVWDRSYIPFLQRLGVEHVYHLPLAASARRHRPPQADLQHPFAASFVGGSLHGAAASWSATLSQPARLEACQWAQQLQNDPYALHKLVREPKAPLCAQTLMLGAAQAEISARRRQQTLLAVPQDALHVWGDAGWADVLPEAKLHGRTAYGDELDAISVSSCVALNVTSAQMPSGVNQRVFDVPQCGGFLLTDRQEELLELFDEGSEVASFARNEDVSARLAYLRARPQLRRRIVEHAQARIAREHLFEHRIARIEAILRRNCRRRLWTQPQRQQPQV